MKNKIYKNNCKLYFMAAVLTSVVFVASFLFFAVFSAYTISKSYITNLINTDKFYNGMIINGVDVSGKTKEEAINLISEHLKQEQENINVNLYCEDKSITINGIDFDYEYDIYNTVDTAYNYARTGNIFKRYIDILLARNNKNKFNVEYTLNEESIEKNVNYIINQFDDKDLEAHVETFNPNSENMFTYAPGKDGMKLEKQEVRQKLEELAKSKKSVDLVLQKHDFKNTSTIDDAKNKTQLIGEFKTISTNSSNSNQNMKISMDAINGTVLNPGDVFSFNEIVGDSNDPKRGFLPGASIFNGSIVMAYGGGICQAATTIYGAAIRADMTIVERRNHRFKSSYVPYGLDATIDYNNIDLKFRNDLCYPVYIKSTMQGKKLECKIYGPKNDKYDIIEVRSRVVDTSNGVKVEAEKVYLKDDKIIDRKSLASSLYRPK